MSERRPTVSIVLPTLNERTYIVDCLRSLERQTYGAVTEILVVDGGSTDGTRDIVERHGGVVQLVDNPRVTAAAALNIGIDVATGEVVCRADAHTIYADDYVERCVDVLEDTGADNVGGCMTPIGTTSFGRAVAAVTSSPLGIGPGKFHFGAEREEVDTVYLGCWRRETIAALRFDEEHLQWGAEDDELNLRISQGGGRIVLDPTIRSSYFPRDTPRGLARQYFNYGVGKISVFRKHRRFATWRPLVPAALVLGSVLGFVGGKRWRRVVLPLAHLSTAAVASVQLSKEPGVAPHRSFAAVVICHWTYGAGFWAGVLRLMTGQPFDARPQGHR